MAKKLLLLNDGYVGMTKQTIRANFNASSSNTVSSSKTTTNSNNKVATENSISFIPETDSGYNNYAEAGPGAVSNLFVTSKQIENAVNASSTKSYVKDKTNGTTWSEYVGKSQYLFSSSQSMNNVIDSLNKSLNIVSGLGVNNTFKKVISNYNRFKSPLLDSPLLSGYGHVFFTKPDCNLVTNVVSGKPELTKYASVHPLYSFINESMPELLPELTASVSNKNTFMFSLSNMIENFQLQDESIETDVYGATYRGYKIAYGKHSIQSKADGTFSCSFGDDRNLRVYQLIKAWHEYIEQCYLGKISPTEEHIINKVLDYGASCYYILTAEDGETIIFWSKYYGVFPVEAPSTQYSYDKAATIQNPKSNISFRYSMKRDYDPSIFTEFNTNSNILQLRSSSNGLRYAPMNNLLPGHTDKSYSESYLKKITDYTTPGSTWVGTPYIVRVEPTGTSNKTNANFNVEYKLRFVPES